MSPETMAYAVRIGLLALVAMAFYAVRQRLLKDRVRVAASPGPVGEPSAVAVARLQDEDEGEEDKACESCNSARATRQVPTIEESRSVIDAAWIDAAFMRFGLRREVQHVVVLERDLRVPTTICDVCHRIARGECELEVQQIRAQRAERAAQESQRVFEFLTFRLRDQMEARTAEQQRRRSSHLRGATLPGGVQTSAAQPATPGIVQTSAAQPAMTGVVQTNGRDRARA